MTDARVQEAHVVDIETNQFGRSISFRRIEDKLPANRPDESKVKAHVGIGMFEAAEDDESSLGLALGGGDSVESPASFRAKYFTGAFSSKGRRIDGPAPVRELPSPNIVGQLGDPFRISFAENV